MNSKENLSHLVNALPNRFDFYHLGEVSLQPTDSDLPNSQAVAFHLTGDLQAIMIVLFDKNLDISTYSELGNILASKVATYFNHSTGLDLQISSPQLLTDVQTEHLVQNNQTIVRRTYTHIYDGKVIPLETLLLSAPVGGIGHA